MRTTNQTCSEDRSAPRLALIGAHAVPAGWVSETVAALGCRDVRLVAPDAESVREACADPAIAMVVVVRECLTETWAASIDRALRDHARELGVITVAKSQ